MPTRNTTRGTPATRAAHPPIKSRIQDVSSSTSGRSDRSQWAKRNALQKSKSPRGLIPVVLTLACCNARCTGPFARQETTTSWPRLRQLARDGQDLLLVASYARSVRMYGDFHRVEYAKLQSGRVSERRPVAHRARHVRAL